MSGFQTFSSFSPGLNLLAGILFFLAIRGTGILCLKNCRIILPAPWLQVAGVVLGIELLSLSVQIAAVSEFATPVVLGFIGISFLLAGIFQLVKEDPITGLVGRLKTTGESGIFERLLWGIILVSAAVNLVPAVLPSAKEDALHYHMLLPARILSDNGLHFYKWPWAEAVIPQMMFQTGMTPLHALGLPHAGNVLNWCLGLTLFWLTFKVIKEATGSTLWAQVVTATFMVGTYTTVWMVSSGAHALGDLAIAACVLATGTAAILQDKTDKKSFAACTGILAAGAAGTKLSLLPVSLVMVAWTAYLLLKPGDKKDRGHGSATAGVVLFVLLPWILFYLPMVVWTWQHSGGPFGPILAEQFQSSVYKVSEISNLVPEARRFSPITGLQSLLHLVDYSPLLWLITFGIFFIRDNRAKWLGLTLLAIQIAVILAVMPYSIRYLGGVHYGVALLVATNTPESVRTFFQATTGRIACGVLLLPWLCAQLVYSQQFLPYLFEGKEKFFQRYVAFYDDYRKLDRILPQNAALIVEGVRLNSIYAPRPPLMAIEECPENRQPYFFQVSKRPMVGSKGAFPGKLVYKNERALVKPSRVPWIPPTYRQLRVYRLENFQGHRLGTYR